jgi:glutamate/aspartate transport system substrate-binding protein
MANGTIDLECGSTTNNLERQKQVAVHHHPLRHRQPLGSQALGQAQQARGPEGQDHRLDRGHHQHQADHELNGQKNLGMNIISANGHPEAFQMVETGRAVAFVMDDILLYSLAAQSRNPKDYAISAEALSVEPYGIMLRRDDPAFKKVVDNAMIQTYKSGAINAIYDKWFQKPVPPRNINLNVPMSEQFKKVIKNPTDSGDPKDYQ